MGAPLRRGITLTEGPRPGNTKEALQRASTGYFRTDVAQITRARVADTRTNADGRTDAPLIPADKARAGRFELLFYIGDYFRAVGAAVADPSFLDVVPIRFSIADPSLHYHVPLVATPWSYATYRGS